MGPFSHTLPDHQRAHHAAWCPLCVPVARLCPLTLRFAHRIRPPHGHVMPPLLRCGSSLRGSPHGPWRPLLPHVLSLNFHQDYANHVLWHVIGCLGEFGLRTCWLQCVPSLVIGVTRMHFPAGSSHVRSRLIMMIESLGIWVRSRPRHASLVVPSPQVCVSRVAIALVLVPDTHTSPRLTEPSGAFPAGSRFTLGWAS